TLGVRDDRLGGVGELLGLSYIQQRRDAARFLSSRESHGFLACGQRALCDVELEVQLAKCEIALSNLTHDAHQHRTLGPYRGEERCTLSLGGIAELPPEVHFPCRAHDGAIGIERDSRNRESLSRCRRALSRRGSLRCHDRELISARDRQLRSRLQD